MIDTPYAVDLPLHADARGWLMATDRALDGLVVAYSYATCCFPGSVKGWHRHQEHEDRMFCVSGLARVVATKLFSGEPDMGPGSLVTSYYEVKEFVVGPLAPALVVVPAGWWHAFQALGGEPCVIVNCPDRPYDPGDEERKDLDLIPFDWGRRDG